MPMLALALIRVNGMMAQPECRSILSACASWTAAEKLGRRGHVLAAPACHQTLGHEQETITNSDSKSTLLQGSLTGLSGRPLGHQQESWRLEHSHRQPM